MPIPSNRWRIAVLLFIAAANIVLPQESKPAASASGRVTNSVTGAPVGRAHVLLYGGDQRRFGATTGVDGKFTISPLPGGNYTISVDAPGFQPLPLYYDASLNRLALRAGEHKNNLDIALTPSGAISGRVLDSDGRALQGMALSVVSIEGVIEGGLSDPDGSYRIGNLPPGKYRVRAEPSSYGNLAPEIRTDGTTEIHYAATYYPASLTLQSAGRIDIPAGAERTGMDIRMVQTPIVAVRGTVSGVPASVSRVSITVHKTEPPIREGKSVRSMFADQRRVNPDGSFVIWRLDPGSYVLVAQSHPEGWASPPLEIAVAERDIRRVVLRLVQLSALSGHLDYADPGARLPKIPANASLAETPQFQMEGFQSYANAFSVIAADGSFHVDKVWPERYSVHVASANYFPYVKSMRLGSTNIEGSILDLRKGTENAKLTLNVSSGRGQISGVVRDDAGPAAYARVAMLPEIESLRSEAFVLTADSDGAYKFPYVAPGQYKIMALDAGTMHARALRYHLDDYQDVSQNVDIHLGDKLIRNLHRHSTSK